MAVKLFFKGSAWRPEEEVVKTMMHVAKVPRVLEVYQALEPRQQETFQNALSDAREWTIKEVQDYHKPKPVAPVKVLTNNAPMPEQITAHMGAEITFAAWLMEQADLVKQYNTELAFHLGAANWLKGGNTVSVPIKITHNGSTCKYTSFVYHYHPDAQKAGVGSGNASVGHFKPSDHKVGGIDVRCKDYHITKSANAKALMKAAKAKAKAKAFA